MRNKPGVDLVVLGSRHRVFMRALGVALLVGLGLAAAAGGIGLGLLPSSAGDPLALVAKVIGWSAAAVLAWLGCRWAVATGINPVLAVVLALLSVVTGILGVVFIGFLDRSTRRIMGRFDVYPGVLGLDNEELNLLKGGICPRCSYPTLKPEMLQCPECGMVQVRRIGAVGRASGGLDSRDSNDPGARAGTLVAIGVGSNMGDRGAAIARGLRLLATTPGISVLSTAPLINTEPVAVPGHSSEAPLGGEYLNTATVVRTTLLPHEVLGVLHSIERACGRDRRTQPHGAPRALDLDLLLYGEAVVHTDELTVPHPGLLQRRFVLEPLAVIAPQMPIPPGGKTVSEAFAELQGPKEHR